MAYDHDPFFALDTLEICLRGTKFRVQKLVLGAVSFQNVVSKIHRLVIW